jgi:hypothetical protein
MQFNRLIYWDHGLEYLALNDRLLVFNIVGDLIAEWYVFDSRHEYKTWTFECSINLLSDDIGWGFLNNIVKQWKQEVDAKLMKQYGEGF